MGVIGRHSHAAVERAEWLGWNHIRDGGQLVRVPTYSDCAIQHPAGVEGFDPVLMQVSATVRYALSDSWLLIKGESTRRRRPGLQFPWLAKQLAYGHLRDRLPWTSSIARVAPRSRHPRTASRAWGQPKCGDALEPSITSPKSRSL